MKDKVFVVPMVNRIQNWLILFTLPVLWWVILALNLTGLGYSNLDARFMFLTFALSMVFAIRAVWILRQSDWMRDRVVVSQEMLRVDRSKETRAFVNWAEVTRLHLYAQGIRIESMDGTDIWLSNLLGMYSSLPTALGAIREKHPRIELLDHRGISLFRPSKRLS